MKSAIGLATLLLAASTNPADARARSEEIAVRSCTVTGANVFVDRVQLVCSGNAAAPPAFATELGIPALYALNAARIAMEEHRTLSITYEASARDNPAGCAVADCRRLVAALVN